MDDDHLRKLGLTPEMARAIAEADKYEKLRKSLSPLPDFAFPSVSSPEFKLPNIHFPSPRESNTYQSASALMKAIADEAMEWKQRVPKGYRPAIFAIMYGGIQISVQTLSQVSFHGIRIEGTLNGAPCSLLAHQSTLQMLCYAEAVKPNEHHNPIGFVWGENKVEV